MKKLLALVIFIPFITNASPAFEEARDQIARFRHVAPSIYAGGNPVSKADGDRGMRALAALGIATVVNLQGGDVDDSIAGWWTWAVEPGEDAEAIAAERRFFEERGAAYFNFPLCSHKPVTAQEDRDIRSALQVLASATQDRPAFLHCEHGADRTGLVIALYRVLYQSWSPQDAHREWVSNGHGRISRWFTGDLDVYFGSVTGFNPLTDPDYQEMLRANLRAAGDR